ncbi:glycoside hydrolase family 2 TIM barrel-domain containing protein [Nibrella saemangeumensis]
MLNTLREYFRFTVLMALLSGCNREIVPQPEQEEPVRLQAVKVELRQSNGTFQLYRANQPYYITGGGYFLRNGGGIRYLDRLAACGGNSIRTWSTQDAKQELDSALKYGLTVTVGLDVARERLGFDYNNTEAVAKQLQEMRAEVLKYKDHPALLMWGIGNELNMSYTNPKVWDAVNDIAKMIHEVDPNHPTTTMLADLTQPEVVYIKTRCPAIDLLSVNMYGALPKAPNLVRDYGWEGAYLVSEWGHNAYWEVPETAWRAPIEQNSREKAEDYKVRYETTIKADPERCLGSYIFLWGQKQERTPTWFSLFTEAGEATEGVDMMQYLWTGSWPQNRAPRLEFMLLDGKRAWENSYVQPGQRYPVTVKVTDPDNDAITYRWELLPESTAITEGGDAETRPLAIAGLVTSGSDGQATLKAPDIEGAYRLFVYATDGKNKVATANMPFFVLK